MTDSAAHFILIFSHFGFIIPMLLIGMLVIDRRFFCDLSFLMAFSIILNVALKAVFQVPLSSTVGHPGFAFPSGHMQLSTVVYASLWRLPYLLRAQFAYLFKAIIVLLLIGIGFSLIYCGYHNLTDVLGAIVVALLLIAIYKWLQDNVPTWTPWLILASASLAMCYIWLCYPKLPIHTEVAYCSLMALILASKTLPFCKFQRGLRTNNETQ